MIFDSVESSDKVKSMLKPLIDDLEERLYKLKIFDRTSEICAYADDLEYQVNMVYDSAIKHLNAQRDRHVETIQTYRETLIYPPNSLDKPTGNQIKSLVCSLIEKNKEKVSQSLPCLEKLAADLRTLESNLAGLATSEIELFKEEAEEMKTKIREAGKRIRDHAFGGVFMKFKQNHLFAFESSQVGKMEFGNADELEPSQIDSSRLDFTLKHSMKRLSMENFFLFLPDKKIITFSRDKRIMKWNTVEGNILTGRSFNLTLVSSTTMLSMNQFATGHIDGTIVIWTLADLKPVRILKGHGEFEVVSLVLLPNGNLASGCKDKDNRIIIWNPYVDDPDCLLFTLREDFSRLLVTPLGLLSNGYLVSCSSDREESILEVWNVGNAELIQQMPTSLGKVLRLVVLSNDNVIVASTSGQVKVFNLAEQTLLSSWNVGSDAQLWSIARLPNDHVLLACDSGDKASVQEWDPIRGKFIQSVFIHNRIGKFLAKVSPDGETLLTTAIDGSFKIWSVSYIDP